ncbi:lantibiotic immunity ABC transporter MutG family permease subunit [Intestinibacter sp.]
MYFMKALRVEHIKSKRTMLNVIPLALSIIVAICILFICRTSNKDEIVSNSMHYWINISAMVVPLLVGILAGIMGEQEQEAGNYQVIRKSVYKGQNCFSKCIYLLSILAFFVLFSVVLLYIGIWCIYNPDNFTVFLFLKTAFIFLVGSIFLVPFQLWSGFYFNIGASIGFGIFGTIFVAYISSFPMIEEKIWRFIPWTWSVKTTSIFFENNNLCVQGVNLPLDLMIQLLSSALLFVGMMLWFKKWEGKTKG